MSDNNKHNNSYNNDKKVAENVKPNEYLHALLDMQKRLAIVEYRLDTEIKGDRYYANNDNNNKEYEELKKRYNFLKEECSELKKEVANNREAEERARTSLKQIEEYKRKIAEYERKIDDFEKEINTAKKNNHELEKLQELVKSNDAKIKSLIAEKKELTDLAYRDFKTKVYNSNAFNKDAKLKKHTDISLIVFSICGVKAVNEEYGKKKGDEIIIKAAKMISASFNCPIYRLMGDQFYIITGINEKHERVIRDIIDKCKAEEIKMIAVIEHGSKYNSMYELLEGVDASIRRAKTSAIKSVRENPEKIKENVSTVTKYIKDYNEDKREVVEDKGYEETDDGYYDDDNDEFLSDIANGGY